MMPIFLRAPAPYRAGPDGRGWNRLSLNAHFGPAYDRCALKPRDAATLMESWSTPRATWGFGLRGVCMRGGDCATCPVFADRPPYRVDADGDRILFRTRERLDEGSLFPLSHEVFLVARPEAGWDSPARQVRWDQLSRIDGWEWDRFHRDQHSRGFWLRRVIG